MRGCVGLATPTPIEDINPSDALEWLKGLGPKFLDFGRVLLVAAVVFLIGRKLIKWIVKLLNRFLEKSGVEESITKFLIPVTKIILNFLLIIAVAGILKIETASFIALLGSAGLTVGLALQGSLSNFAGGVLILLLKPFRLGDYIVSGTNEGTVTSIDIFYTRLLTVDNRLIVLPNGILSNSNVINATNEPVRRLILTVSVAYTENIKAVKEILNVLALSNELVLKEDYAVEVLVNSLESGYLTMCLRVWVETEFYWELKARLLEEIKEAFENNHIDMPLNKLDVTINNGYN